MKCTLALSTVLLWAAPASAQLIPIRTVPMQRLLAIPEYVRLFEDAFPTTSPSLLRFKHAADALATFQMEEFTKTRSPFDRYSDRDDAALTTERKRGGILFFGEAQCGSCHNGPFLGAQDFANVGAPQLGPGVGDEPPLDLSDTQQRQLVAFLRSFIDPAARDLSAVTPASVPSGLPIRE